MGFQGTTENRIDFLDVAKGIGILLVCIGHACTNQSSIANCQLADVIRFATLFHMALFFFINGMLYSVKYSQKPISGIYKKVKAYYIPFVGYNLFFWVLHNVFAKLQLISGELDPKDYAYSGIKDVGVSFFKTIFGYRQRFSGAMWFLECLIIISILFILTDFVVTKWFPKRRMLLLSIAVVVILIANRLLNLIHIPGIPSSLSQMLYWGLNGLIFFYLGYVYKVGNWNQKLIKHKYWIVPVSLVIVCTAVFLMRPSVVSVITNQSIPVYRYGVGAIIGNAEAQGMSLVKYAIYVAVAVTGIVMVLLLSQYRIVNNCKLLKVLGRYSLHIMCLQFFAFKAVSLAIIIVYKLPMERLAEYPVIRDVNGLWWLAYTLVGSALPIAFGMVLKGAKARLAKCLARKG